MSDPFDTEISSPQIILVSAVLGATVFVAFYITKLFKGNTKEKSKKPQSTKSGASSKELSKKNQTVTNASNKSKKKAVEGRWVGRRDKQTFSHPWLLTSLKGHTGRVLDMDFSSNGKYLASCSEDSLDPGGGDAATSSGSECNKENSRPTSAEPCAKPPSLSRRQRKNRRPRDDNSSPEVTKRKTKQREMANNMHPPLRQHTKLNVSEAALSNYLRHYLLVPEQLLTLGYPVESGLHPGRVIIYKSPAVFQPHAYTAPSQFDVNAREFVPRLNDTGTSVVIVNKTDNLYVRPIDYSEIKAQWNEGHENTLSGDSGQGSGSSSPVSVESDACDLADVEETTVSEEKKCVRCGLGFFVGSDGEYLTQEHCQYHWGKLQRLTAPRQGFRAEYGCCRGDRDSKGCTIGKLHVWNGISLGINGPFEGFVKTKPKRTPAPDGNYGVYALDCEMCYTSRGLELAKVTVITSDGRLVYDSFVKPECEIVDYNTRFSGITARDFSKKSSVKSLKDVQNDLMGFINADTILIGHGLENDLRALRIIHCTVVDTAITFPHYYGLPYRRALKSLVTSYLKREIQCGNSGHNSFEDARACMELMLWRVRKDFRNVLC